MDSKLTFYILFGVSQVFGVLGIVLLIVALNEYATIDWTNNKHNVHKLLMPLGMVYLSGTASVLFRGLTCFNRLHVKYMHGCLQGCSFILGVVGLVAIFDAKSKHLTTYHGWLGLITVILFAGMWFFSLLCYLYPQATESVRQMTIPYHRKGGLVIFSLSLITTLIGLNGSTKSGLAQLIDRILAEYIWSGFFLLLFGITIAVIVLMKSFKRGLDYV